MPRLTITEIAAQVGVHKSTVSRQARRAGLVGADGLVDLNAYQQMRDAGIDPALQTTGRAAASKDDGTFNAERTRKMAADAQLAEMELERQRGRLVDAALVEAQQEDMARRLREAVMAVARSASADCARLGDELAIEGHLTLCLGAAIESVITDASGRAA